MVNQIIEVVVKSDKGIVKKVNQDNFLIKVGKVKEDEFGLFAICDGLGGLSQGEVASKKVVLALEKWWNTRLSIIVTSSIGDRDILMEMGQVINKVNEDIINYSKENSIKIGTTSSILLILNRRFYICHIGDSRIYTINEKLNQLTKDHTYYNKLVEEGNIEKSKTVKKSILTQCIGANISIKPNFLVGDLNKNTLFILCSDGFYNKMTEGEFFKMKYDLEETSDYGYMGEVCTRYIENIKAKGEKDNISVIGVKFNITGGDKI
ncbi:PP2C family protein-serine/threonine phosphatase [Clostridium paraputrificum]|uniref:PP2C family protein-serine/threonine phosphatase n=1 Tax=Clostridium paraputrificum TaxID=29363 RepID=UPI003D351624